MPELKTVLPSLIEDGRHKDTRAYKLRNQQVTAIKRTAGAPCSSHEDLFAPWPGTETNVAEWYILENGYAVGTAADRAGTEPFPVVLLTPDSD